MSDSSIVPIKQISRGRLTLSFPYPRDDIIYQVEAFENLINWIPLHAMPVSLGEVQTVTDRQDAHLRAQRFIKLQISMP